VKADFVLKCSELVHS